MSEQVEIHELPDSVKAWLDRFIGSTLEARDSLGRAGDDELCLDCAQDEVFHWPLGIVGQSEGRWRLGPNAFCREHVDRRLRASELIRGVA